MDAHQFIVELREGDGAALGNAMPGDEGAAEILHDFNYEQKMSEYDEELREKTSHIWQEVYKNGNKKNRPTLS